jgi:hypothetical protein
MFDPHGYYLPKIINYRPKTHGVPFFEDFPISDFEWTINDYYWKFDQLPNQEDNVVVKEEETKKNEEHHAH